MTPPVKMYSTVWCGHCRRLKRQLEEAGIAFDEVDVDEHPGSGERIVAATGYCTVPTLEIAGRLLVNPTVEQVRQALGAA